MTASESPRARKRGRDAPELGSESSRHDWVWLAVAILLVIGVALGLRFGTNVLDYPELRDEALMKVPIDGILDHGWSVETALDYQEVKGPTFYWSYALAGEFLGDSMNAMRLVSIVFFVLAAAPLLLIARRVGVRGPPLVAIAGLYVLLPYNAFTGQLLFSEPSFNFFALWMVWAFVWGFGASSEEEKRVWGPVVFAVLLSVLLHHRPHAVAFAAAVAFVGLERDGWRCWPWILACALAGLSRLPLWAYWGGLVTSDYQNLFGLGLRLDSLTYMLAVILPWTAVFIWPAIVSPQRPSRRLWVVIGAGVGLALGAFASPDIHAMVRYTIDGEPKEQAAYAGVVATTLKMLLPTGAAQQWALACLSTLGGASIASMMAVCFRPSFLSAEQATDSTVRRLAFWTIGFGVLLYVITRGPVYDRYPAIWFTLLPIVWIRSLPRWLVVLEAVGLFAMASYLIGAWLM